MSSPSTSCPLDPLPTWLLKKCVDILLPIITKIVNLSMATGSFPAQLKKALVVPLIKKPSLDRGELRNYRPVSNLSFLSKTIERTVVRRVREHLVANNIMEPFQSAYRPQHSTETALIRITNDILLSLDDRKQVLLLLLDLSAAFDTVDHAVLLNRLDHDVGLGGPVLSWFKTYLTDRSQVVHLEGVTTGPTALLHGVPQGSVLGPMLFTLYTLHLGKLISQHGFPYHLYADDCQLLYMSQHLEDQSTSQNLKPCIQSIISWMCQNKLKLNMDKTEALAISSSHKPCMLTNLDLGPIYVETAEVVRNLGSWFDRHMTLTTNVRKTCTACFMALRKISAIRQYLDRNSTIRLIQAYVTSRLDFNNGILTGLPGKTLNNLQRVQNTCARLICKVPKYHHISPYLMELHWLPVKYRIEYKTLVHCYKSMHNESPHYLTELLQIHQPSRNLRSAVQTTLSVPRVRNVRHGERAFSVVAPKLWNGLNKQVRNSPSTAVFKKSLKTVLFRKAYDL